MKRTQNLQSIRRALLSVSDKSLLEELARGLVSAGVELLATGGTAERLRRAGIAYRSVEDFTGNPEAFDGRMKTLSFKLESAILFDRAKPAHVEQARALGIEPIDLVVCNFYPFERTAGSGASLDEIVDEIDVGGPTMVRAAAKNFRSVSVLIDPEDYHDFLTELRRHSGSLSFDFRRKLMVKAFEYTAQYDRAVYEQFAKRPLRYGENPHQAGYFVPSRVRGGMNWDLLDRSEAELSYNNYLDAQAAYSLVRDVRKIRDSGGICAIVKHGSPCGLATGPTTLEAFERAWEGDPASAFGGTVVFSSHLTVECARLFEQKFVEVVAAPGFEEGAVEELKRKKKKLRILKVNSFDENPNAERFQRVAVEGGTLIQEIDSGFERESIRSVTKKRVPESLADLARFGVIAAAHLRSNGVAIVRRREEKSFQLVGTGGGQPNRVDAVSLLAIPRARAVVGKDLSDCLLASDAFFPFADSVVAAAEAGLPCIIQPGGSLRDAESIAAADERGIAMAFTGRRHFRH